jgi:predicted AlkP superfamily pyrophosphatase or phosphodiesterase
MIRSHRVAALIALLWLVACATPPSPTGVSPAPDAAAAGAPHSVLLVSLDGVHPDYLGRGDTPHLDRLARDGVRAEWMRPSYPALTFPNHYTIVTGLRPDRHGIIHNTMADDDLGHFRLADRDAVGDGRWWGGEPLWVTAENAGLATATLSWPGSEAPVRGVRPSRWHAFDYARPVDTRVDMVVGWLGAPASRRPRFATLYFEHPDKAGHEHGPDSPELRAAMRMVDAAIGRLVDGLAAAGVRDQVDLVIVSDHGMAEVRDGHVVAVEDMVAPDIASMATSGQVVGFRPAAGRTAEAEAALLGRHPRYACWRRDELPARWHYGSHPRVPPIVCQMDVGWDALPRKDIARRPAGTRGSHGFDPATPQMRAIFIANGPSFRRGAALPAFDNVDVYPLLARLLDVPPAANDGDPQTLLPALRDGVPGVRADLGDAAQ